MKNQFDLQLFADENEGYSIDQAVELLNGVPEPEKPEEIEAEQVAATQPDNAEEETDETEQAQVAEEPIDYSTKVRFKANGQEVEKSIQDLINDAQLANNYNQKMQEIAVQRKAFEVAMQQQKPAEVDPAKDFEELNEKVTARAMKALGIKDPEEFQPDAMGIMGNKAHFAAYQKALLEIQQEQHDAEIFKREQEVVEQYYVSALQTYSQEKDFVDVNKYAEQALFLLPQSGGDGVAEFSELYPIYQNLKLRDQKWLEEQQFGKSDIVIQPLTKRQYDKLLGFYAKCKTDFANKQTKETVKAAVPKSVPIKPTVKVESTTDGTPTSIAKKVDKAFLNKIREMSVEDVAKLI